MRQILFIVVLLCCDSYAQKNKAETTFDRLGCEIKYLKDQGFLPSTYPSQPPTSSCEALNTVVAETFSKLGVQYEKFNFKKECAVKALKGAKAEKFWLLRSVYSKATHLSQTEKDKKIKELKEQEKVAHTDLLGSCIENESFNELFDHLYNSADQRHDHSVKEDYCVRKYVMDHHLIDRSYNLKLNPQNIAVATIKCDPLIEESRKDAEKSFTEERDYSIDKKICIRLAFQKGKYFDSIAPVTVMKGSNISTTKLAAERVKFTTAMGNFMKQITSCVSE